MARKKLDLTKAQFADGALSPIRSVYELVGQSDVKYRETTYAGYQQKLRRMDMLELQDHAYSLAIAPSATKDGMIDRLERKYLKENPEQCEVYHAARTAGRAVDEDISIVDQAGRILARGR